MSIRPLDKSLVQYSIYVLCKLPESPMALDSIFACSLVFSSFITKVNRRLRHFQWTPKFIPVEPPSLDQSSPKVHPRRVPKFILVKTAIRTFIPIMAPSLSQLRLLFVSVEPQISSQKGLHFIPDELSSLSWSNHQVKDTDKDGLKEFVLHMMMTQELQVYQDEHISLSWSNPHVYFR